jgi:uncharacterized protein
VIKRQTSLSGNIVQFCRFLRLKGFIAGADEEAAALNALRYIDYSNSITFRLALKTVLCKNKKQIDEFDGLFITYWKELGDAMDAKIKSENRKEKVPLQKENSFKSLKTWLHGNHNNETEETATYSIQESLLKKNFSAVPENEVEEMMQTIKALSKRLASKINRRYEHSHHIDLPDLRQTLRKNLRRGGELMDIIHRKPKRNRVKLVLLCDVSKSMELYTAFLIQFMYAFQQVYSRMETFVFSTSLQRITSLLKQKNYQDSLQLLGTENQGWSGGTRIGESLNSFVNDYSKQLLDPKTIVIILSDGWDTGNTAMLERSMELIHAKSKKIIWLNPLAGYTAYRPDTAAMKTALPYVDVFAAVHNAESLTKLGRWL